MMQFDPSHSVKKRVVWLLSSSISHLSRVKDCFPNMVRQLILLFSMMILCGNAFVLQKAPRAVSSASSITARPPPGIAVPHHTVLLFSEPERRDASRSGTKRERLDKLAELEENRVETDKGFVLKATGGFVGLLVVLLAVAFSSGVLDSAFGGGY